MLYISKQYNIKDLLEIRGNQEEQVNRQKKEGKKHLWLRTRILPLIKKKLYYLHFMGAPSIDYFDYILDYNNVEIILF